MRLNGFTLLEVMLTLAILAIIFMAVNKVVSVTVSAQQKCDTEMKSMRTGQALLDLIANDIGFCFRPVTASSTAPLFTGDRRDFGEYRGDQMTFLSSVDTRNTYDREAIQAEFKPGRSINQITYFVEKNQSENGLLTLYRTEEPYQYQTESDGKSVILCDFISHCQFQYYDGIEWKDHWQVSVLPQAVKVVIRFNPEFDRETSVDEDNQSERIFSTLIRLPVKTDKK